MEEKTKIVKDEISNGWKFATTAFMFIGIVATGNVLISGGKKFAKIVSDKIIEQNLKKGNTKEEA